MDMPRIETCDAQECAYNHNNMCHALAITVGGPNDEAACDTYWCKQSMEGGDPKAIGRVGACHMASCMYNQRLECASGSIGVSPMTPLPGCMTYEKRM